MAGKNKGSKKSGAISGALTPEIAELAEALAALPPEMRAALLALAKGK